MRKDALLQFFTGFSPNHFYLEICYEIFLSFLLHGDHLKSFFILFLL